MIRGVGLRGAIAVNVITMIGIGPLITIPLVLATLHGGLALIGWVVGAIIALCDGLVWAELSSRYPGSGGTYLYLREAFGRDRWGRLFAFLFNWQFIFFAPLLLASGYIGFASYAGYFFPLILSNFWIGAALKIALGCSVMALLYQRITGIAKVSIVLGLAAVLTLVCVIAATLPHANFAQALSTDMTPGFNGIFIAALGMALIITVYDYVGYSDVALIGDEVREPNKTIPLAIVYSVIIVAVLYLLLQLGVLGVVHWHALLPGKDGNVPDSATYIAATVVEQAWGKLAAWIVTGLVLITAFASLYGNLLGFSRIPYAAARDGLFFPIFRHLHKTGSFPNVSLIVIGVASIRASFLTLGDVLNYLTAGIVIIQGVAQIVAVWTLRVRSGKAPFSMWLFPLPALIALAGWIYVFVYTGNKAILFGIVSLLCGIIAFGILAKVQRTWPFVIGLLLVCAMSAVPAQATVPTYGHSSIVQEHGYPIFEVDHKPFFVYGAAFFYERIPHQLWRPSLQAYKNLGINTIDLYIIWNWHELSEGIYDFTGATTPRRDLRGLLALIHEMGFKTIIRPGPVIRNEWRNGGYPAWLLKRPEYNMPLHDILEGRYPATATLQNAHSDDAAAEWMNNSTHMSYASRWLRRALTEIKPWAEDVIAVALDDDQAAYIDNQTWPAPHLQKYLQYLNTFVHSVTGPNALTFINTYQMKVTASSPVWAWGNWYQSDVYTLGEHDRSQLEFSTALLQTQPHMPVMASEFQAGWLQGPDEAYPRPANPVNTELALHTMLQMGARGVVNFPVQDTINPTGWEAPFANAAYAWDAALTMKPSDEPGQQLASNPRALYTQKFGQFIREYGPLLASTHRASDAAIAYMTSAYAPADVPNSTVFSIAAQTTAQQKACRDTGITCDLVDLRYVDDATLSRYPVLVLPRLRPDPMRLARIEQVISRYQARGGTIVEEIQKANLRSFASPFKNGVLSLSDGPQPFGFLDIVNYGTQPINQAASVVHLASDRVALPPITVAPNSARTIPLNIPLRRYNKRFAQGDRLTYSLCGGDLNTRSSSVGITFTSEIACTIEVQIKRKRHVIRLAPWTMVNVSPTGGVTTIFIKRRSPSTHASSRFVPADQFPFADGLWTLPDKPQPNQDRAVAYRNDVFADGQPLIVLRNQWLRLIVAPAAGARAFDFDQRDSSVRQTNGRPTPSVFTSIGGLRDDVATPLAPSTRDYIAKYTHQFPAGTFNRPYDCTITGGTVPAEATCRYVALDLAESAVTFERTFAMEPNSQHEFSVAYRMLSPSPKTSGALISSLAVSGGDTSNCWVFSGGASLYKSGNTVHSERAFGLYDARTHLLSTVRVESSAPIDLAIDEKPQTAVVRIIYAANAWQRVAFGAYRVDTLQDATRIYDSIKGR